MPLSQPSLDTPLLEAAPTEIVFKSLGSNARPNKMAHQIALMALSLHKFIVMSTSSGLGPHCSSSRMLRFKPTTS